MNEWPVVTVDEIAAPGDYSVVGGPFGSSLGRSDYVDDGVPVIRGAQLGGPGIFSHDDLVFVTEIKADRHRGNLAFPGDVLVTQRGTVGQVGMVPLNAPYPRYLLSQSQMKLTVDPERADPRFLYYALLGPDSQHALQGSTMSAGVPHINLALFKGLKLALPPLDIQKAICQFLGSIDDLIENNRRRVQVLEEMAKAIYREWFVRFRYPGHEAGHLVDSPIGQVPHGWKILPLDGLVSIGRDTVDAREVPAEYPAVGLEHIPRRQVTLDDWGCAGQLQSRKTRFHANDILFGKIRPYFHKVSVAPLNGICSTDAIVIRPRPPFWGLVVMTVSSTELVAHATQTSSGTKMPRADWKVLGQYPVAVPPESLAAHFTDLVRTLLDTSKALMFSTRRLSAIRELMLPKLVTGYIDVSKLDLDAVAGASA